jgi:8-oxo-dGTP diphosphatase
MEEMKPIKRSVAFVIYNANRKRILAVQRPSDDDNLPDVWGLPAGTLKENESFNDAVERSAKEKLGVTVEIIKLLNEGKIERNKYTLFMKEYEVKILKGKIVVPQNVKGITQYQKYKWATPKILVAAAQKGSLCSRLYLATINSRY